MDVCKAEPLNEWTMIVKASKYGEQNIFVAAGSVHPNPQAAAFELPHPSDCPTTIDRPVIFIIGANTGRGFETVKAFFRSSKTYTILLGARNKDKADGAVQQLRAEFPNSNTAVAPVQVDLENDLSIKKAIDFVAERYGRVDVLINTAGKNPDKLKSVNVW